MTAFSRLSRFGMTFKPLTASRGEAVLMSYLEAFPVKTFLWQEKAQESKESDLECGEKWLGWSAKFDPHTSTLRTAQCSLLEEEPELLQTLPRSGMTRSGMLWERQTLVRRIDETESGSWAYKSGLTYKPTHNVPTPTASDHIERVSTSKEKLNPETNKSVSLDRWVKFWPTPTAHNAKETNAPSEYSRNTPTLAAQVGGTLNPTWVEWLMGWPLGWTDLKPLGMDRFQQWQQQHFNY